MNKQDAERVARVARRIGLSAPLVIENKSGWCVFYRHGPDDVRYFDPITKASHARRLWDWVEARGEMVKVIFLEDGSGVVIWVGEKVGQSPCRVTALLMAIDALPEGGG